MRIARFHELGAVDSLRWEDLPAPAPGHGQALVRVRAAALNFRDLLVAKGLYSRNLRLPLVPLSDGAGEVVEIGPGVTRVRPGDRVAATFMPAWIDGPFTDAKSKSALGAMVDGMLAEYVTLDQEALVPVPEHLTFEEAATLPCAAVTAWHALVTAGRVQAGDTVLTLGTGGVSLFAVQFARLHGARVIVTSSSDTKLSRARELGATDGINYKTTPDWDKAARALTGGEGVDHVIELGGAGTLPLSLKAIRAGGRVSLIGVLSGAGEVNPMPILMKGACVQGIFVGSRGMFEAMNRAIALHQMKPIVDRVFAYEEAVEALRYLESGSHFGKVVIRL